MQFPLSICPLKKGAPKACSSVQTGKNISMSMHLNQA